MMNPVSTRCFWIIWGHFNCKTYCTFHMELGARHDQRRLTCRRFYFHLNQLTGYGMLWTWTRIADREELNLRLCRRQQVTIFWYFQGWILPIVYRISMSFISFILIFCCYRSAELHTDSWGATKFDSTIPLRGTGTGRVLCCEFEFFTCGLNW